MDNKQTKWDKFLDLFPAFFLSGIVILALILSGFAHYYDTVDSTTVTAECKVEDMYHDTSKSRGRVYYHYYVTLSFEKDGELFTHDVEVTHDAFVYGEIAVGDTISCEVTYNRYGISEINILEENIEYPEDPFVLRVISIILAISLLLLIISLPFQAVRELKEENQEEDNQDDLNE